MLRGFTESVVPPFVVLTVAREPTTEIAWLGGGGGGGGGGAAADGGHEPPSAGKSAM